MRKYKSVPKESVRFLNNLDGYKFDRRYCCDNIGQVYLVKLDEGDDWFCQLMSPFKTRDGYIEYVLTSISKRKVHIQGQRIVAGLYCPRKVGSNYVNHKDGKRHNNFYKNLEWVTQSENILHSYRVLRGSKKEKVKPKKK